MKILRQHQSQASRAILAAFKTADRTNIVMPCGSGKSIIGVEITRSLDAAKRVVFFAPSLALIGQTMNTWKEEGILSGRGVMCVCSDQSLAGDDDIDTLDYDISVTTAPEDIHRFMETEANPIIFCTYQSSPVLKQGLPLGMEFDLAILDEAHRTAGDTQGGDFGTALADANIPIKKRLFMTATPKHYVIVDEADKPYSMDDTSVYGSRSYTMSIRQAVEQGIICDYQVMVSITTEKDLPVLDSKSKGEERSVGAAIAIRKAMEQTGAKKAFLFATSVSEAIAFTKNKFIQDELAGVKLFHVSGKMKAEERKRILKEFEECERGIVTNVRCLSEGVDVPVVDMVVFLSNKRSTIDIVQAAGRAMRLSPGKQYGYILLPLYVNTRNRAVEDAIQSSEMNTVFEVLITMAEQEESIAVHRVAGAGANDGIERNNKWRNFQMVGGLINENAIRDKIAVRFVKIMNLGYQESVEKKKIAISDLENIRTLADATRLFAFWNKKQVTNVRPERYGPLIKALNDYYMKQKQFDYTGILKQYPEKAGVYCTHIFFNDYLGCDTSKCIKMLAKPQTVAILVKKLAWLRETQGDFCTYLNLTAPVELRVFGIYAAFLFEARKAGAALGKEHYDLLSELDKLDLVIEMVHGMWFSGHGFNMDIERWKIEARNPAQTFGKKSFERQVEMIKEINLYTRSHFDISANFEGTDLTRLHHLITAVNYGVLFKVLEENDIGYGGMLNHISSPIERKSIGQR